MFRLQIYLRRKKQWATIASHSKQEVLLEKLREDEKVRPEKHQYRLVDKYGRILVYY